MKPPSTENAAEPDRGASDERIPDHARKETGTNDRKQPTRRRRRSSLDAPNPNAAQIQRMAPPRPRLSKSDSQSFALCDPEIESLLQENLQSGRDRCEVNDEGDSSGSLRRISNGTKDLKLSNHSRIDNSDGSGRRRQRRKDDDPNRRSGGSLHINNLERYKASDKSSLRKNTAKNTHSKSKVASSFSSLEGGGAMEPNSWHGIEPMDLKKPVAHKGRRHSISSSTAEGPPECLNETTQPRRMTAGRQSDHAPPPQKVGISSGEPPIRRFSDLLQDLLKEGKDGNGIPCELRRNSMPTLSNDKDLSSGPKAQPPSCDYKTKRSHKYGAAPWAAVGGDGRTHRRVLPGLPFTLDGTISPPEDDGGHKASREHPDNQMERRKLSKSCFVPTNAGELGAGATPPRKVSKSMVLTRSEGLKLGMSQTEHGNSLDRQDNETATKRMLLGQIAKLDQTVCRRRRSSSLDTSLKDSESQDVAPRRLSQSLKLSPLDVALFEQGEDEGRETVNGEDEGREIQEGLNTSDGESGAGQLRRVSHSIIPESAKSRSHAQSDNRDRSDRQRRRNKDSDQRSSQINPRSQLVTASVNFEPNKTSDERIPRKNALRNAHLQESRIDPKSNVTSSFHSLKDDELLDRNNCHVKTNTWHGSEPRNKKNRPVRKESQRLPVHREALCSDYTSSSDYSSGCLEETSKYRKKWLDRRRRSEAAPSTQKIDNSLTHASSRQFSKSLQEKDEKEESELSKERLVRQLSMPTMTRDRKSHQNRIRRTTQEQHTSDEDLSSESREEKLPRGYKAQQLHIQQQIEYLQSRLESKKDLNEYYSSTNRQQSNDEEEEEFRSKRHSSDSSVESRKNVSKKGSKYKKNGASNRGFSKIKGGSVSSKKQKSSSCSIAAVTASTGHTSKEGGASSAEIKSSTCSIASTASEEAGPSTKREESGTNEDQNVATNKSSHSMMILGRTTEAEGRKKRGFYVSPFMLCILCFCYGLTLCLVGFIGFGIRMLFFSDIEDYNRDDIRNGDEMNPDDGNNMVIKSPPSTGPLPLPSESSSAPPPLSLLVSPSVSPSLVSKSALSTFPSLSNNSTVRSWSIQPSRSSLPSLSPSTTMQPSPSRLSLPSLSPSTSMQPSPSRSSLPSLSPSKSMQPSPIPSYFPSLSPTRTVSFQPSLIPSYVPSFNPTSAPECPEQLVTFAVLDDGLTLRYQIVPLKGDLSGLLCISLEYTGAAGWIGLAFSEASRDPQFGRKEAIIGIPGLLTSVAVATGGDFQLGQQAMPRDEPRFFNPGKYILPAGGEDGYYGPSLKWLRDKDEQTLMDGSVSAMNAHLNPSDAVSDFISTKMSFVKYLREPGEIAIDPYGSTLLLFAVATVSPGDEDQGNPEWQSTKLQLLEGSSDYVRPGLVRKRKRHHLRKQKSS